MGFSKGGVLHKLLRYGLLEEAETASNKMMKMYLYSRILKRQHRRQKYRHARNGAWQEHVAMCEHTGGFERRYHMTKESFDKLVDILDLPVNEVKSRNSTRGVEPIHKEIIVASGLRYLGGESYKSIADIFHMSDDSARRVVNRFINAVIESEHEQLALALPKEDELEDLAVQWSRKSTADGIFHGCVLALDGFLSPRLKPNVVNAADYFSGHKKTFALNVQAACDHNLKFRYAAAASPGKANDGRAVRKCKKLQEWIRNLRPPYFIVADNAYPLSDKILIPFKGRQRDELFKSSYNFYLSQLRIRIEMAFGRLTTKFRVLRSKMACTLSKQSRIIQAVTRLHNFIIDNDGLPARLQEALRLNEQGLLDDDEMERLGIDRLEEHGEDHGFMAVEYDTDEGGVSARRDAIVQRLTEETIVRPHHNVTRNNRR
jgi:hypothetical protein